MCILVHINPLAQAFVCKVNKSESQSHGNRNMLKLEKLSIKKRQMAFNFFFFVNNKHHKKTIKPRHPYPPFIITRSEYFSQSRRGDRHGDLSDGDR